jgi:indole-3-glycerol phosphate synthase
MDLLQSIMAERRGDVAAARRAVPLGALRAQAAGRVHHSLVRRLRAASAPAVIAEMKKASPSAGPLRADYDPAALARSYAAAGAAALSVLTEPRHFGGAAAHLQAVRAVTDLPVLRKDFLCDEYQVAEAAAWGADVVLLIVAALPPERLRALHAAAQAWGLETLAEAHTEAEVEAVLALDGAIVGVNNRDLKTLATDPALSERLAARLPPDRPAVSESGLRSRADIDRLWAAGYRGFLVGEALMRGAEPGAVLRGLTGAARTKG